MTEWTLAWDQTQCLRVLRSALGVSWAFRLAVAASTLGRIRRKRGVVRVIVEKGDEKERATIEEKEEKEGCAAEEEEEWSKVSFLFRSKQKQISTQHSPPDSSPRPSC